MELYFGTYIGGQLKSVSVTPASLVFIPGVTSLEVTIANTTSDDTKFKIFIDNDSLVTLSKTEFSLSGGKKETVTISPLNERIPVGMTYSCLVIEATRKEAIRMTVPMKFNKF